MIEKGIYAVRSNEQQKKYKVLILCTGNSARSIMVEALFNSLGSHYFQAYSAGSHPTGEVNPFALEQIKDLPLNFKPLSKSRNEFASEGAPKLDLVITVCGNAAQEACPSLIGEPKEIHWGVADPAAVLGNDTDKRAAFSNCFDVFSNRIAKLITEIELSERQVSLNDIKQSMLTMA